MLPVVPAHNMPSEATSKQINSGSSDLTLDSVECGLCIKVFTGCNRAMKPWTNVVVFIDILLLSDFEGDF
jgi:hypothetical protein